MGINVLSLFDGIRCGMIALEESNIPIDNYYSSEIDPYAIMVADKNYPEHSNNKLGDITKINSDILGNLPEIDLLIGGSPCQNFSFAGKRNGISIKEEMEVVTLDQYLQLKLDNFEFIGQSYLFWEYMRILKEVKPKYFMLENVNMSIRWKNVLSKAIGIEPIKINSALFSAQKRNRLYWTNIPNINKPNDLGVIFRDIIDYGEDNMSLYLSDKQIEYAKEKHRGKIWKSGNRMGNMKFPNSVDKKSQCLSAVEIKGARETNHIEDIHGIRVLSVSEYEKLQTLPIGYTNYVNDRLAKKMIGNGWNIKTISHIFNSLKNVI